MSVHGCPDPSAAQLISTATGRDFVPTRTSSSPASFFAFRGGIEPLDREQGPAAQERLEWDVRRSISAIVEHPWIPTSGPDAVSVRGFIYDVDTGLLSEVTYPGAAGSLG